MSNHYAQLEIQGFQLSKVLRQAYDSDILKNATDLRSAPENTYPSFDLSGKNDLIRLDGGELEDELDSAFSNYGVTETLDRKSTRLNSSHVRISYAVFCLKKKTS